MLLLLCTLVRRLNTPALHHRWPLYHSVVPLVYFNIVLEQLKEGGNVFFRASVVYLDPGFWEGLKRLGLSALPVTSQMKTLCLGYKCIVYYG